MQKLQSVSLSHKFNREHVQRNQPSSFLFPKHFPHERRQTLACPFASAEGWQLPSYTSLSHKNFPFGLVGKPFYRAEKKKVYFNFILFARGLKLSLIIIRCSLNCYETNLPRKVGKAAMKSGKPWKEKNGKIGGKVCSENSFPFSVRIVANFRLACLQSLVQLRQFRFERARKPQ